MLDCRRAEIGIRAGAIPFEIFRYFDPVIGIKENDLRPNTQPVRLMRGSVGGLPVDEFLRSGAGNLDEELPALAVDGNPPIAVRQAANDHRIAHVPAVPLRDASDDS